MANKMLFGYNFGKLSIAVIPAHQAKAEKGDWMDVDVTELHDDIQLAYEVYKEAYKVAKAHKAHFEALMKDHAGLEDQPKAAPKARQRQSLADYLASRT